MSLSKLPKAPLQEVIFEARWQLNPDPSGKNWIDPQFDFALGKFQDLVKREFPETIEKYPKDIPNQFLAHQTMYQFWKSKDHWPVIQIGPGVLTVNDTDENYIWEDNYLPLIQRTLRNLEQAYDSIRFQQYSLRYIDVVDVEDYGFDSWQGFVQSHVNFSFENQFDTKGQLSSLQFNQVFNVPDIGQLSVAFSSGVNKKKKPTFMWQIGVLQQEVSADTVALEKWLDEAHDCTSQVFKDFCKKEFYESFIK